MAKDEPDPLEVLEKFLQRAEKQDGDIYVAIDPGAEGAIGLLCGKAYAAIDIPTIKTEVKRIKATSAQERAKTGHKTKTVNGATTAYNYAGICAIFNLILAYKEYVVLVLEKIPFKTSKGKGYTYADVAIGQAYALWPLFLYAKGYAVEEVPPNVWKQKMGLAGKDKEASRLKALSLFPRAALSRKKDHDRAEALLMAEYVKRTRQ